MCYKRVYANYYDGHVETSAFIVFDLLVDGENNPKRMEFYFAISLVFSNR